MTEHPTDDALTTEAEEMYLITTARAIESGVEEPVPMARLAKDLGVSTASANQMVRKLAERGLVTYAPYKGVTLRAPGRRIADAILRRRRLWGVFLWDRLGLDPARADDVACDMEHITPDDVTERLAGFLDDPPVGPTGRPIPTASGAATHPDRPLADGTPGEQHRVAAIAGPPAAGAFLSEQGIAAGDLIDLMAVAEDGSALVATPRGVIRLGPRAAGWIHIEGRP